MDPSCVRNLSPVSPPSINDERSGWDVTVAVDDVDAGDDKPTSRADVDVLACNWSAGSVEGGTAEGSTLGFVGLFPVTGLQTPELSSGQRKTSIGPRVLVSDTW